MLQMISKIQIIGIFVVLYTMFVKSERVLKQYMMSSSSGQSI